MSTPKHGTCPTCGKLQLIHLLGDEDITEQKAENFRVGHHTDSGTACAGYDKPPTSLYFPQGGTILPREKFLDMEQFELGQDGEYHAAEGDDGYPDDDRLGM